MIQYQVSIEVDEKGSCKIAAHKLTREDANHNEGVLADVFEEHNQELMKRIVEEFKRTNGWKGEYKEMDEKGVYQEKGGESVNATLRKKEQQEIVTFLENARNEYGKQDEFWAGMNFAIGLIKESDGL